MNLIVGDIGVEGTHSQTVGRTVNNLGPNDWIVSVEERGRTADRSRYRVLHVSNVKNETQNGHNS
ncbi:MAG: hypothetical protein H8E10_10685 [Desulfobacterales bacterium]|nr:hypothetical protein [Desulfobacterales bacterium]